jgi:taurine--2-oxoglutarate transaminase
MTSIPIDPYTADEWQAEEKAYVLHTWTAQSQWNAPTVVGGSGAWFRDDQGRRYLDLSAMAECSHLGHQHPAVVEAIKRQADEMMFVTSGWGNRTRTLLAKKVVEHAQMPGGKVFFALGGAEANENAIKMARWMTGRQKVITRHQSYHGATAGAMELSSDNRGWSYPPGPPGVVHALPPYCYRCPFGQTYPICLTRCADHIAELIEWEGPDTVAAVLVEPAAGTNGITAPREYWPRLREICDRYGVLLIADEVMSGFGRTGTWFAWQASPPPLTPPPSSTTGEGNYAPDMMTLAKGLTAAYMPLGAVVVNKKVADYFEDHVLETGLTYSGHPMSCAAGLAALETYEREGLIERSQELGAWMHGQLREMAKDHPSIGDIRGQGLFAQIEFVKVGSKAPLAKWPQTPPVLRQLVAEGRKREMSFAVRGNLLILCPPLVIEQADLAMGLRVLDELLAEGVDEAARR